jgi:hypothetical protein
VGNGSLRVSPPAVRLQTTELVKTTSTITIFLQKSHGGPKDKDVRANQNDPSPWNVVAVMHFPPALSSKRGLHSIVRILSLLMLQPISAPSFSRTRLPAKGAGVLGGAIASLPYLKIVGTLPLRFNTVPLSPKLDGAASAGAQLMPAAVAPAKELAAVPLTPAIEVKNPSGDPVIGTQPKPSQTKPPLSILPDDASSSTKPEDFLPFFQFPGGNGNVSLLDQATTAHPPAPGQLPPSSATYQQK